MNGACGPAIGYMGVADARNVNSGPMYWPMTGSSLGSVLPTPPAIPDWTPIRKGLYSFWSYEHLFIRTGASANVSGFRTALGERNQHRHSRPPRRPSRLVRCRSVARLTAAQFRLNQSRPKSGRRALGRAGLLSFPPEGRCVCFHRNMLAPRTVKLPTGWLPA